MMLADVQGEDEEECSRCGMGIRKARGETELDTLKERDDQWN